MTRTAVALLARHSIARAFIGNEPNLAEHHRSAACLKKASRIRAAMHLGLCSSILCASAPGGQDDIRRERGQFLRGSASVIGIACGPAVVDLDVPPSLGASPDLQSAIRTVLDRSRYFILLASPEAAASTWVN